MFGNIDTKKFLINQKMESLIREHISNEFNVNDEIYPVAICRSYYLTLIDAEKGIFKRPIQKIPNYRDIILPENTRTSLGTCNYYICLTGRFTGHKNVVKGKGHKRNLNNTIDTFTGLYGSSKVDKLSSTITERPSISHTTLLCNICYQETGKGKQHKCRHSTKNVIKIIEKLPENNQEQIVSAIMKRKVQKIEPENNRKKILMSLPYTHGEKIVVIVNPHEKGVPKFSAESLDNFRVNSSVSAIYLVIKSQVENILFIFHQFHYHTQQQGQKHCFLLYLTNSLHGS